MYIPSHYHQTDSQNILAFMREFPFAVLISNHEGKPFATHIPFVIIEVEGKVKLRAHVSKANLQWQTLTEQEVLVIFSEPHAYISPSLYSNPQNVPTWNYMAVHAYGTVRLADEAEKGTFMEEMIEYMEPNYRQQWDSLTEKYKTAMQAGIVAFEIEVTDLQGKWKLNQNKSAQDRQNVAEHLQTNPSPVIQRIAQEMQQNP